MTAERAAMQELLLQVGYAPLCPMPLSADVSAPYSCTQPLSLSPTPVPCPCAPRSWQQLLDPAETPCS